MKTQGEAGHLKPRREASQEINPINTWVWDFQPPEL